MIETNFTPFPILTTNRLILRQIEATDKHSIFSHRLDDRVNTYLESFRHSSLEETEAFIDRIQHEVRNNKTILWVITEKDKNEFIGTICLWNISKKEHKAETGYTLSPEFQNKGYMNEALNEIIDFGFNKMKLQKIEAYTHKENAPSIKLLLKNKFIQDEFQKVPNENNRLIFQLTKEIE